MNLDDIRRTVPIESPDVFAKHFPSNNLSRISHQEFQQAEFDGGQIDVAAGTCHASSCQIERQVIDGQHRYRPDARSTDDRIQSRQKLCELERFWHVIVGTSIQSDDPILHRAHGREQNYRSHDACGPNFTK